MTVARGTELARLINDAGPEGRQPELASLLAGIAASPAAADGISGLRLLQELPGPLRERLRRTVEETAARFDADIERPDASGERLAALRAELQRRHLHGFVVPLNDEYNGEYIPRRAQRLTWLTAFTGSAGLAIVLQDRAAVFTDGRYTLQVRSQVDGSLFSAHHITDEPPTGWLAQSLAAGQRLGYDPWLHTVDSVARLRRACEQAGAELVAVDGNPVDAVWPDQPPPPLSLVEAHPIEFAGETAAAKRNRLAEDLRKAAVDAVVLTLPESVAWLLNIRGADVPHTPLPLSFAILRADGTVALFMDGRKAAPGLPEHLGDDVTMHEPADFGLALDELGRIGAKTQVDPGHAAAWIVDRLRAAGARLHHGDDPCLLPKACKNPTELEGARQAHLRDGAAVVRFLAWLADAVQAGPVDEITAAARLQQFRQENEHFRDLSFATISGAGPNGAVVHYRVTPATNRRLEPGSLYLVDSGAQYLDGTTDITRTIAIGEPSGEMRDRFTRVLKGHIAIATCRFPVGTSGSQLDTLARHALWQAGLDYDHGTGHGVGSYLSVHEGPHRISKAGSSVPLRPGMIVSNEPGYYNAGAYGIRIENLVVVTAAATVPGGERALLAFETLTRVPIDRSLVEPTLLTAAERDWLDGYHAAVRADLLPRLTGAERDWLIAATEPLSG